MSSRSNETKPYELTARVRSPVRIDATVRDVNFTLDSPPSGGGENAGPLPAEAILGGLAGCLNAVGHKVASEMNLSLRIERVHIVGHLNPAKFHGQETEDRAGFQSVEARVEIDSTVTDEEIDAWLREVEARNPVLDNIQFPTEVTITVE
ncbi:OsmC family protein [Halobium palmae]|uniref:OsmC family protein n=1 Tax=Halobium palmae TaxID=1776492 RepID=A0ABD5RX55_9EURY